MKAYIEVENGISTRDEINGAVIIGLIQKGDTRTDTDEEGFETIVDLWQEAIDAGAVMLTDEDKAATLAEQEAQAKKQSDAELKLAGVEFDGVMCSATAEDQHGLADVEAVVRGGLNINFHFENGTKLLLTSLNIDGFRSVWFPFRLSFFE